MTRRRSAALLAFSSLLLAPASASAQQEKCQKTAVVRSGMHRIIHFEKGSMLEVSEPLSSNTIRRRSGFYKTSGGSATLDYDGNTYKIAKNTTFKIVCYGRSVKTGLTLPALDLFEGEVNVRTIRDKPGGVVTTEGLYDPRVDSTMKYRVTRELRDDAPEPEDIFDWFARRISAPLGRTLVNSDDDKTKLGITPYVGSKRGVCRYVHGAELTSKGTSKGYFTGTATYFK